MSSNKRRKINSNSAPKNISAFAARRQRKTAPDADEQKKEPGRPSPTKSSARGQLFDGTLLAESSTAVGLLRRGLGETHKLNKDENGGEAAGQAVNLSDDSTYEDEDEVGSSAESREGDPVPLPLQAKTQLTTVKASSVNTHEYEDGSLLVKIAAGERLVILGQYSLSVLKGQISILGATLSASAERYQVYALSSHSLPVIRCFDENGSHIRIYQCNTGLISLKTLSPLFQRLSNQDRLHVSDSQDLLEQDRRLGDSSFQIIYSSEPGISKLFLWPVQSPPEWNELIVTSLSGGKRVGKRAVTIICGPKSSGKSTFSKLMINRLLTEPAKAVGSKRRPSGVALLDLDPGQPEYSPPGHLSLIHLLRPNFGTPYSHPDPSRGANRLIRSHSIGAISPSADPGLYMTCVVNLLAHYNSLSRSTLACPLIINTPGWILGTGLQLLIGLIKAAHPTEVVYMSTDGPLDVVSALKEAAKKTPVFTIPSQASEYATRTAAHLRTMQMMSYFHIEGDKKSPSWNALPLTSRPPWRVRYSGDNARIRAIMCLGEQPSPEMLEAAINGTVLSIVIIDNEDAVKIVSDDELSDGGSDNGDIPKTSRQENSHGPEIPLIVKTPEGMPYINPNCLATLDPRHSHCIGLALVRGIDTRRKELQLLSPLSGEAIAEATEGDKSIVLLSGKLDTPGWAYTEELNRRAAIEKRRKQQAGLIPDYDRDEDGDEGHKPGLLDGTDSFESVPWIEKLQGHEGRGVGARVWRVRRDLGRARDGGP